jgi:hypothetical protein
VFSQAGESPRDLARELVRVMKVDGQAEQMVEQLILSRCRAEDCDNERRSCMLKFDHEAYTDSLMWIARRELTTAEMKAGIEYFRSEVGMKHRQIMRAEKGLSTASLSDQRPEDRVRMLAFLDTPEGYRLVTRAVLTNTSEVVDWIARQARMAFADCKP